MEKDSIGDLRRDLETYSLRRGIKRGRKSKIAENLAFRAILRAAGKFFAKKHINTRGYVPKIPKRGKDAESSGLLIGLADAMADKGDIGYAVSLYAIAGVVNSPYVYRKIEKNKAMASSYQLGLATELLDESRITGMTDFLLYVGSGGRSKRKGYSSR